MTADYRTSVGDGFLLPSAISGAAVVLPLCFALSVNCLWLPLTWLNGAGFNSHLSGHLTGRSSRYRCRPRFFARHRCTSCGAGRDLSPAIATPQERTIRAFFALVNTPPSHSGGNRTWRHPLTRAYAYTRVRAQACTGANHRRRDRPNGALAPLPMNGFSFSIDIL